MTLEDLLRKNRSYRRFCQDPLDGQTLVELVGLTRLCPSAANRQPLKYIVACSPKENAAIFPHLAWAGALVDWPGPDLHDRPTGYIIILGDTRIINRFGCDHGIAAQSILLAATERGLGGCMIGSIDRRGLRTALGIGEHFDILLILALGKPSETVVIEDTKSPDQIDYWRDEAGVHHVPKRPLDELLVEL